MSANRQDGCSRLGRVLIQKLVGRYDRNSELSRFGEDGFNVALVRHEVLDFVAIESEERPLFAGEERVLQHRKHEASERERLLTETPLFEIHEDPISLVHRFAHREGRFGLPHDVPEPWVGGECRSLVKDGLSHHSPHRFAYLVIAGLEILPDLGVLKTFEAGGTESGVSKEGGEFDERKAVRRERKQ